MTCLQSMSHMTYPSESLRPCRERTGGDAHLGVLSLHDAGQALYGLRAAVLLQHARIRFQVCLRMPRQQPYDNSKADSFVP